MPLVSVLIPTYNRPEMLRLTLDSVLNQTFSDFEVIVVDDGTPSGENEGICKAFQKVQYFKIANSGGPSKPRNYGIQKANGKYVAFLDDDDLWLPQKLEKQVEVLENHPEFGLVHTPCFVIDATGNQTVEIIGKHKNSDLKHGDVSLKMIGRFTLMTSSVLIRKDIFNEVGYFNADMPQAGEDTHFWTRCSFYTKFYYFEEPLVYYRKHEGASSKLKAQYFELPLHLNEALLDVFSKGKISKKEYSKLRNNIIGRQLKEMPAGKIKTIKRLFKLYPFWFLNFENVKICIRAILS